MFKKFMAGMLVVFPLTVSNVYAYSDVPKGHWAEADIQKISDKGIMQGMGDDKFGLGMQVKRSEFAVMLCKLMGWEVNDAAGGLWYEPYVKAAYDHGLTDEADFRPNDYITRREMAHMLVRALGFTGISTGATAFKDADDPYITAAYDFGIISGRGSGIFAPEDYASREEGAAMMCRLYDRYTHGLDSVHGFYAISSWSQRETAAKMNSVSFGWSRLEYDGGVVLNTTSSNGNDWHIPEGYQDAVSYFAQRNIPANLAVTMSTSQQGADGADVCRTILLNDENRAKAVSLIAEQAKGYSGVTADFEGLKGAELREGLNKFLKDLRAALPEGKQIYTNVHPVMNGEYFDGYDYKTIASYSDMVIVMAHDYAAISMTEAERASGFTVTPVTPLDSVYTALKAASDNIEDKSKIALALSVASTALWTEDGSGAVINERAYHPDTDTVAKILAQPGTSVEYSQKYHNPMAVYYDEKGNKNILWYENAQSIKDKIVLAKMFGIDKISIWRIGQITDEVWNSIEGER